MIPKPGKTVGKLPSWRSVERVLVGLVLLCGIHLVPMFLSTPNKAKEAMAKSILQQMNQEQQQFYSQNGAFLEASRDLESFKAVYGDQKRLYRFFTRRMGDKVYSYAEPTQEYEFGQYFIFPWNRFVGLKRYVGIVRVTDRNTRATQAGICYIRSLDAEIVLTEAYGALSCRSASH